MMHRTFRRVPVALLLLAAAACAPLPPPGVVYVSRRPPPDRVDVVVMRPGPGYAWVRGYWRWDRDDYVWMPGRWVVIERGYRGWAPGRWVHHRRGWYWVEGHWR